ncbi:mitochondrial carrier domain-containing protein [Hyaloraphidium curvatum]|nr:mitochondrial carrier domain-containing protein [Hyaloraphidium curvatum]
MWLRTAVNYQSRHGGTSVDALKALYAQGGIARFYEGVTFAILQGPLARFGGVAANEGARELAAVLAVAENQRPAFAAALGSLLSTLWRVLLMPIDTCKTVLQVDGRAGLQTLLREVRNGRPGLLFEGTVATAVANVLGHYPWFFVHNLLEAKLPRRPSAAGNLFRTAVIGFLAACASDAASNSLRVLKTVKQADAAKLAGGGSYLAAAKNVLAGGGAAELFGRGLALRVLANGVQSVLFVVVWKKVAEMLRGGSGEGGEGGQRAGRRAAGDGEEMRKS